MKDAELVERLFAQAGRMLDANTLLGEARALEVARVVAELARTISREPSDRMRVIGEMFLGAEGAAEEVYEELRRTRLQ